LLEKINTIKHDFKIILRNRKNLLIKDINFILEEYSGIVNLTNEQSSRIAKIFGGFNNTDTVLLKKYGIPRYSISEENIVMVDDFNSTSAKAKLNVFSIYDFKIAVFLDCLLDPWWIKISDGRIVNAHSAILPNAKGMHAIEQVAATCDLNSFIDSCGATLHYIDNGIDTGNIIKKEHLKNPLSYKDIWEVKAESYLLAFNMLTNYVDISDFFSIKDARKSNGNEGKLYLLKNFTTDVQELANNKYLTFRNIYNLSSSRNLL